MTHLPHVRGQAQCGRVAAHVERSRHCLGSAHGRAVRALPAPAVVAAARRPVLGARTRGSCMPAHAPPCQQQQQVQTRCCTLLQTASLLSLHNLHWEWAALGTV